MRGGRAFWGAVPLLPLLLLPAAVPASGGGGMTPSQAAAAGPGQITTVCGVVVEGGSAPAGGVLLHLGDAGKQSKSGFAVLIEAEDRTEFPPSPEKVYLGKRVCATGMLRAAEGLPPHITVRGTWQFEDVDATSAAGKPTFQAPKAP